MMRTADVGTTAWKSISRLQLFISERNYPDGTNLTVDVAECRLLRFKTPMVSRIDVPRFVLLPRAQLPIAFEVIGTNAVHPGSHDVRASLIDSIGRRRADVRMDLSTGRTCLLKTAGLTAGRYRLDLTITAADGTRGFEAHRILDALAGPLDIR